jgi:hypothetical protein
MALAAWTTLNARSGSVPAAGLAARGTAVRPGLQREDDPGLDPVVGAADAPPDDAFRAALDDLEGCRRLGGVTEVDRQLPADLVVADDRVARPPPLDPRRGGCELVHVLRRRVDR